MFFRTYIAWLLSLHTIPSTNGYHSKRNIDSNLPLPLLDANSSKSNLPYLVADYSSYPHMDRSDYTFRLRIMDYNVQQLDVAGVSWVNLKS